MRQEAYLRRMTEADMREVQTVMESVGWHFTPQVVRRRFEWSGETTFCIEENGRLCATGIGIAYGTRLGWVGMIITHTACQRRGFARQMTVQVIESLQERGVACIMLDASRLGQPLYEQLGFHPLYDILIYSGRATAAIQQASSVRLARAEDIPAIIRLDGEVFGIERAQIVTDMIEDFPDFCWVDVHDGAVNGFLLAQPDANGHYAHIGAWAHQAANGADGLFGKALERFADWELRVEIPEANSAAQAIVTRYGLAVSGGCTRMVYANGVPPSGAPLRQFGIMGFSTG